MKLTVNSSSDVIAETLRNEIIKLDGFQGLARYLLATNKIFPEHFLRFVETGLELLAVSRLHTVRLLLQLVVRKAITQLHEEKCEPELYLHIMSLFQKGQIFGQGSHFSTAKEQGEMLDALGKCFKAHQKPRSLSRLAAVYFQDTDKANAFVARHS